MKAIDNDSEHKLWMKMTVVTVFVKSEIELWMNMKE